MKADESAYCAVLCLAKADGSAAKAKGCAIRAFIGFHGQKFIQNNSDCRFGLISPIHKRTEGRAPVWGSEFTSKDAALQGESAKRLLR